MEQQIEIFKSNSLFWTLQLDVYENWNEVELFDMNVVELFEAIILPLPLTVKEEMLLENWENAGHQMVHSLFQGGNYDFMLCYLLLFFLKYNAVHHKLSLREDALSLLNSFHVLFRER